MHRFQPSELTPETDLLLHLSSPYRTPEGVGSRFARCSDWTGLLEAATRHQTLTLLAMAIHEHAMPEAIPAPVADRLRRIRLAAVVTDHCRARNTRELLDSFRQGGIEVMLLKGQSIAERLYLDPSERFSTDIDILVHRADLDSAGAILEKAGYRSFRPDVFRNLHFHIPYFSTGRPWKPPVELHWDVAYPDGPVHFDTDSWWARGTAGQLRAGAVLLPPPEEELVYLSFHALNRGVITLRQVADVARLRALNNDSLDWDRVFAYAAATGTGAFFRVVHRLSEAFWPLPPIDLPPLQAWRPAWKLRVASNLLSPATVLRTGCDVWWPYKRIACWALLAGGKETRATLFSVKNRLLHEIHDGESEAGPMRSYPGFLARMLAGLLFCMMPGRLFPSTRDQVHLMARRGGIRNRAGGTGTP